VRAGVFPHRVMPVGPLVSALGAPVVEMMSNPPVRRALQLKAVARVTSLVSLELHALYLDRSRDARPLPRGFTGHLAHPLRSILHRGLVGALLWLLFESPAAPSPALRPLPMSALAAR